MITTVPAGLRIVPGADPGICPASWRSLVEKGWHWPTWHLVWTAKTGRPDCRDVRGWADREAPPSEAQVRQVLLPLYNLSERVLEPERRPALVFAWDGLQARALYRAAVDGQTA